MVECDKCADKLRCTTGQVEECNRGFKLKMCCRKHLAGKKEDIIRLLVDCPNEMIIDNFITYRDICPMCSGEIFIRLQMCDSIIDTRENIIPSTEPYPMFPYPGGPYIPSSPNTGGGTWCSTTSKGEVGRPKEVLWDGNGKDIPEGWKEKMCASSAV